jgi:CBS-domain-containing membrane protein
MQLALEVVVAFVPRRTNPLAGASSMQTKSAPTAGEIMTSHVQTIGPDMPLNEVSKFLLRHHVSNAPVVEQVDGKRKLLGFVSEADCLDFLTNELFYGNPSPPQTASTIMKRHPTCVTPETDVFTLTSIFVSHRFRHLPVVEAHHLVGIVSRSDVLKSVDSFYRNWSRDRDNERFPVDVHEIINHRFIVGGH